MGSPLTEQVVLAMLDVLDTAALRELQRALRGRLHPAPTAAADRKRELGELWRLLEIGSKVHVERQAYDRGRSFQAPTSHALLRHYAARTGKWQTVCDIATGRVGSGRTWTLRDDPYVWMRRRYSREEALNAIRSCAADLGRVPSASDYFEWRRVQALRARSAGQPLRLPVIKVFERLFPPARGSWRRALFATFEE
jgi:hypothetical protein